MRRLLEQRRLLEGGAYFNVGSQKRGAYQRVVLIWGPALIRGNTVFMKISTDDLVGCST